MPSEISFYFSPQMDCGITEVHVFKVRGPIGPDYTCQSTTTKRGLSPRTPARVSWCPLHPLPPSSPTPSSHCSPESLSGNQVCHSSAVFQVNAVGTGVRLSVERSGRRTQDTEGQAAARTHWYSSRTANSQLRHIRCSLWTRIGAPEQLRG